MKKRFFIAAIIFIIQALTFFILPIVLGSHLSAVFLLAFFVTTFYLVIYFIGGLSKLFVYLIYGISLFLLIYFFNDYSFAFIIIGTFIFLLNPLGYYENRLSKLLDSPDPIEFQMLVKRSYYPIYDYRAKMKEYFHLPQTKKFYQKRTYYRLINITTFILAGIGIFLSLMELNMITTELQQLRLESILVFYVVIVVFISALIIYKKGFKSFRHFITPSIFLPTSLIIFMTDLSLAWQISIASVSGIMTIILIIIEVYQYFQRVDYHASTYLDTNTNYYVYANVLYEPYMYNDYYTVVGKYEISIDIENFHKKLKNILTYANFKMFFITAYVDTGKSVIIYTQFQKKHEKLPELFSNFIEKTYNTRVKTSIKFDPSHLIYEENFFKTDDYITARAISFGKLIKSLGNNQPLIISMYFYFTNVESLKDFIKLYKVDIMSLKENVITVKVEFEIVNVDYLIDLKVREILLNVLINDGHYIRITAAIRGDENEN